MIKVRVTISGLKETSDILNSLEEEIQLKVDSLFTEKALSMIAETAKLLAPVSPFEGGSLRDSINYMKTGFMRGSITDGVPYGKYHEFGFMMTLDMIKAMAAKGILLPGITGKHVYPHWVQQPFMLPAVDINFIPILEELKLLVDGVVKDTQRKL